MAGLDGNDVLDLEESAEGVELTMHEDVSDEIENAKIAVDPGQPSERQIQEHRHAFAVSFMVPMVRAG